MSWEKGSDLDLFRSMLESADIDFEEMYDDDGNTLIELSNGIAFSFSEEDGALEEITNG